MLTLLLTSCLNLSHLSSTREQRELNRCNRKLYRVIEKCPALVGKDTVFIQDTIQIPEVRFDTITELSTDTVEIRKDHLQIRYVTLKDSIWIEGQCDTIEVIRETPVYVTKIEQVDVPAPYIPWWIYVVLGVIVVAFLVLFILRWVLGGLGR